MNLHIFALAAHGKGLSGGDRIFIELARRWSDKFPITIYVTNEGYEMCQRQKLWVNNGQSSVNSRKDKRIDLKISNIYKWSKKIFFINYLFRIIEGIKLGFTLKFENSPGTLIYNASEFWMDSLPCVILKLRFPKIRWIATWFQTAPNPLYGYTEQRAKGKGQRLSSYKLSSFYYWLTQLPIKPLITKFADKVMVNNEDEKKRFPKLSEKGDTIVMIGAVPLESIKKWKSTRVKEVKKICDAVFQGRFHPQKGVLELLDIWKLVVKEKPDAKLAMIGDGPLMEEVKKRITQNKLTNNINLYGYVFDGPEKYKIFSQSKVVVHPAYYDSGGMASAEAMAFGLPCVGFNLKAYESYYPKGMVKVDIGNKKEFANQIIRLLTDRKFYEIKAEEALTLIEENWSWEIRSEEILSKLSN